MAATVELIENPRPCPLGVTLLLYYYRGTFFSRRIAALKSPRSRSQVANKRAFEAPDESSQQRCASRLANNNRRCRSKARHRRRSLWFSRIRVTIKARSLPQRRHVSEGVWSAPHVGHFKDSRKRSSAVTDSVPPASSFAFACDSIGNDIFTVRSQMRCGVQTPQVHPTCGLSVIL